MFCARVKITALPSRRVVTHAVTSHFEFPDETESLFHDSGFIHICVRVRVFVLFVRACIVCARLFAYVEYVRTYV
jgi:hypothetical protein